MSSIAACIVNKSLNMTFQKMNIRFLKLSIKKKIFLDSWTGVRANPNNRVNTTIKVDILLRSNIRLLGRVYVLCGSRGVNKL